VELSTHIGEPEELGQQFKGRAPDEQHGRVAQPSFRVAQPPSHTPDVALHVISCPGQQMKVALHLLPGYAQFTAWLPDFVHILLTPHVRPWSRQHCGPSSQLPPSETHSEHAPARQIWPAAHALPQEPQSTGLSRVFVQATLPVVVGQHVRLRAPQLLPHLPQFGSAVVLAHSPRQHVLDVSTG
jgi:hypothetical protein